MRYTCWRLAGSGRGSGSGTSTTRSRGEPAPPPAARKGAAAPASSPARRASCRRCRRSHYLGRNPEFLVRLACRRNDWRSVIFRRFLWNSGFSVDLDRKQTFSRIRSDQNQLQARIIWKSPPDLSTDKSSIFRVFKKSTPCSIFRQERIM